MVGDVFYYGDCHFSHDDNVDELKSVALRLTVASTPCRYFFHKIKSSRQGFQSDI